MLKLGKIIRDSSGDNIYKKLSELVDFGDRYAGSKADNDAAKFVANEFEKSGFEIINEEFEGTLYEEFETTLEVGGNDFYSRAMSFSIPTEELEKDIVFVEYGRDEDYKNLDVQDKIVIALRDGGKDHYWEHVSIASKNGAVGFVLVNDYSYPTITTLETGHFDRNERLRPIEPKQIPAIVVGREDCNKILELINSGKINAKFKIDAFYGKRNAINVRAIKKGTEIPEEKIVIYGHRDTVGTLGANDNGSGTVVMLEIARILKDIDLKRTVELISFSAEEHLGSEGSIAYLERHKDDLDQIVSSIELDMIGVGSTINVMSGGKWEDTEVHFSEALTDYIVDVADQMGYYFIKDFSDMGTPDSGRFAEMGVETTWIWCPDDVHYHSPEDTLEKVDINKLKTISDVVLTAIYDLGNK